MSEPSIRITCPLCRHVFDAFAFVPWGDGNQDGPVVPFICGHCGEASLLNLVRFEVVNIGREGWDLLRAINPKVHREVMEACARVRTALAIQSPVNRIAPNSESEGQES